MFAVGAGLCWFGSGRRLGGTGRPWRAGEGAGGPAGPEAAGAGRGLSPQDGAGDALLLAGWGFWAGAVGRGRRAAEAERWPRSAAGPRGPVAPQWHP